MKRIICLFVCLIFSANAAIAGNQHQHPEASKPSSQVKSKRNYWPGPCEITINNRSYDPISVYGVFDDGQPIAFNIYPGEPPHAISLFYYGACHYEMFINVTTFNGYTIYSNYTPVDSRIDVWPGYFSGYKAVLKR